MAATGQNGHNRCSNLLADMKDFGHSGPKATELVTMPAPNYMTSIMHVLHHFKTLVINKTSKQITV
jgi:hypothetical protein